jgi:hypothetical protein
MAGVVFRCGNGKASAFRLEFIGLDFLQNGQVPGVVANGKT